MTFQQPAWLALLLLVPFLVTGAVLTARLRRKQWAAFVSPRLRGRLLRRGSPVPRWLSFSFLLLSLICFAFALARPQTMQGEEMETTRGRNVLIALDLSRSMLTQDLKPDRLGQAKTLCFELIEALPNDRVGVVAFAGEALLSAPLTIDHGAVREVIDQLDTHTIPVGGSNVAAGVSLAIKTLKETGQKENALVLLTDGEETVGRMTALGEEAKRAGVYVFAIAIGTEGGEIVPNQRSYDGQHRDRNNRTVVSRLDTSGLKRLALETNGRFAVAASASNIPDMVKAAISDLDQFEIAGRKRQVAMEYYQWFLLPGILMLMAAVVAGTRWRRPGQVAVAATALAGLLLLSPAARADLEQDARAALEAGDHERAQELFKDLADGVKDNERGHRFRLAEGTAAARRGDLTTARTAFSEALRSKDPVVRAAAHHGMGNVLFGIGWENLSKGAAYPETGSDGGATQDRSGAFQRILDALMGLLGRGGGEKDDNGMGPFDEMVRARLMEWFQGQVPDSGESEGFTRFRTVITDWTDAVKHYQTALELNDGLDDSKHNRQLVVTHLKRLREILEELEQNAQEMQAAPQAGEGEGEEMEGQGGEGEGEPNGQSGNQEGDQEGQGGNREGEENENDRQGNGPGDPSENKDQRAEQSPKPGESPDETARRILRENADFERGAPRRGRVDYEQPEKDW